MGVLTKDQILAADDITRELLHVPEWGGDVYLVAMTGEQRDKWELEIVAQRGDDIKTNRKNIRATLASMVLQDEQGNLLFSVADIEALGKKSSSALNRIFTRAMKINKLGKDDLDELEKK